MKLRYFQTYDENGVESEVQLQYWDKDSERWEPINLVRVRYNLEEEYMTDPSAQY